MSMTRLLWPILLGVSQAAQTMPDDVTTNNTISHALYKTASLAAAEVGTLPPQTTVEVRDILKVGEIMWVRVSDKKITGWIRNSDLSRSSRLTVKDYETAVLEARYGNRAEKQPTTSADNPNAGEERLIVIPSSRGSVELLDTIMSVGMVPLMGLTIVLMFLIAFRKKPAK